MSSGRCRVRFKSRVPSTTVFLHKNEKEKHIIFSTFPEEISPHSSKFLLQAHNNLYSGNLKMKSNQTPQNQRCIVSSPDKDEIIYRSYAPSPKLAYFDLLNPAYTGNLDDFKTSSYDTRGDGLTATIKHLKDGLGRGSLAFAAAGGRFNVCEYLLEELKVNVNEKDDDGDLKFWKKKPIGFEFSKHFRSHYGPIEGLAVSTNGRLCCATSNYKLVKIYNVINCDIMIHSGPVKVKKYNHIFDTVISADDKGFIEYWCSVKLQFPQDKVNFKLNSDTNLLDVYRCKISVSTIEVSPGGKKFAITSPDRKIRVFHFRSGTLWQQYDESLEIVNLETNEVEQILGKVEMNDRFLKIALYQGYTSTNVRKISAAAANVDESKDPSTDPTLLCCAFKKHRIYLFREECPKTVDNFITLCRNGYYNHSLRQISSLEF
ncbi:hypothetical protein C5167_031027 [Papaver somniferum]|nr:hypothetical protein C5167_031027 [Papaver somniferum]